ncbi:hypothetical protein ACTSEZ_17365 [Metabacillus sp. JX24]|uniref:hypothetical protein n=1 Tax=Metabacillus sp. JX24 TaxID=3240759 RepID=UPI00350EF705
MFKLGKVAVSGLFVVGLLAGCGDTEQSSGSSEKTEEAKPADQKPLKEEKPSEPKKDESGNTELLEVGQKAESDAAKAELLKIKQVNETIDIAPLKVTVKDVKVIKLTDLDPAFVEDLVFQTQSNTTDIENGFSYIQVQYTAENTSEGNVDWYDLMNVVTDKGEQIDGQIKDMFFDDSEMDSVFIGKVKKDFQDGFIVKDAEIGKVKLVFGNTMNADTYEDITGQQTVEYTLE